MEQTREMAALQNLIVATRLYLNTLDELARPATASYLQNSIDLLVVALTPQNKTTKKTKEDRADDSA